LKEQVCIKITYILGFLFLIFLLIIYQELNWKILSLSGYFATLRIMLTFGAKKLEHFIQNEN